MNKLIGLCILLIAIISCNNDSNDHNAKTIVCEKIQQKSVIDTVVIDKKSYNELNKLSQAAKDVAIYFLINKDKWRASSYVFKCDTYEIWIANGFDCVSIYNPIEYELNDTEKDYFWSMYKSYQRKEMRLFKHENEISFKVVDK